MATGRVSKVKGKVVDIPGTPTIGTATDPQTDTQISVAFTADSSGKGGPTFSYIATSNPGSITGTGTTSPIIVSGLTTNTSYTFTVAGVNGTGASAPSAASNSVAPTPTPSSYESIATTTLSSTATSVTFSSIPDTYRHLQLRVMTRFAGNDGGFGFYYNGDTNPGNYRSHFILNGSASNPVGYTIGDGYMSWTTANNSWTAGFYTTFIVDITNYTSTNKNKVSKTMSGAVTPSNQFQTFSQTWWNNQNAINSIRFDATAQGGTSSFAANSTFALYGIKG